MKRITFVLLLLCQFGFAQNQSLSLDSCLHLARINYPLMKQDELLQAMEKNSLRVDNKNWLPKLSFNSRASYQSEVITFQGFSLPHESMVSSLSVEQSLFDGGQTHQTKAVDRFNNESKRLGNEVDLYTLTDRIAQLYCRILLGRESVNNLRIVQKDLQSKHDQLAESVKNGLALQSNLDEMEAQQLTVEQNIQEQADNLAALYQSMNLFTKAGINDSTVLSLLPPAGAEKTGPISRPETKLFDAQKSLANAQHKLNNAMAMPRLSVSADVNYGRPGPNFFNTDFRFYNQANVSLRWNIATLYNIHNESVSHDLRLKMIDVQQETFNLNTQNALLAQESQIRSLKEIIKKDDDIIAKRHRITETASSQLVNGAITTSDYLTQLNNEMQSLLNKKIHEVKLLNAITQYGIIKGIDIH